MARERERERSRFEGVNKHRVYVCAILEMPGYTINVYNMKNYMRRSDRGCACICEKFKDVTVYGMRVM